MSDYNANAYGIGDSRKTAKDNTTSALKNPLDNVNKGQQCMRFQIAAGVEIMGGEIWVNKDTTIANNDTLTVTVLTG
jgi:hypothetical protein